MEMTKTQKMLVCGLKRFPISEETLKNVFLFLRKDEAMMKDMIRFLVQNEQATEEDIMSELTRILSMKKT